MASDGDWGAATDKGAARHDEWIQATFPLTSSTLPEPIVRFARDRGLEPVDLARVGARWQHPATLVYYFDGGLKYRDVINDVRWNEEGARFDHARIVRHRGEEVLGAIVAEGETDAAALARHAPSWDIAVLPAGARRVPPGLGAQLRSYPSVLVALDADEAGDAGSVSLHDLVPRARRLRPPDGTDWCAVLAARTDPEPWNPLDLADSPVRSVFSLRELVGADLGERYDNHYFAGGILPIRGQLVFHGALKSLKSVVMGDMLKAIAAGLPFADWYEWLPSSEGARVLLFQFEITPYDYQQRVMKVVTDVADGAARERLLDNFGVFHLADNQMPRLRADDTFLDQVLAAAEEHQAAVLAFDPLQRMTGSANVDKSNEMDALLDAYSELQARGFTVIYAHHNNKQGANTAGAYSMVGTQRFGSDADAVCSLYRPRSAMDDDNNKGIKQRNFTWTLRSGATEGRSVEVGPNPVDSNLMDVKFGPMLRGSDTETPDDRGLF